MSSCIICTPHQTFVCFRKIRLLRLVALMVERRGAHKALVGRTEET